MSVINTNIQSLIAMNNLRTNQLGLAMAMERLSSGSKINRAADDPSGLAIATGMTSQINGIRMAVQNAEDTVNLIQTADGALNETTEILQRMRDLAVRSSNEAVLTTADRLNLHSEFASLMSELDRKARAVTFNTKHILDGSTTLGGVGGAPAQIGPDNGAAHQLAVLIPDSRPTAIGGDISLESISTTAGAQSAITKMDAALNSVSGIRSSLGVVQRRLGHIVNDLSAADINISAARSRIQDTDYAETISELTRRQILQQVATAMLAQANAQPQSVLQLLK